MGAGALLSSAMAAGARQSMKAASISSRCWWAQLEQARWCLPRLTCASDWRCWFILQLCSGGHLLTRFFLSEGFWKTMASEVLIAMEGVSDIWMC